MPASVPAGPRDLIHRMLVLDPAKRITIAEIRRHPWFISNGKDQPPVKAVLPDVRGRGTRARAKLPSSRDPPPSPPACACTGADDGHVNACCVCACA